MTNAFACVRMHVEVHRSARVVFYVHVLASYFRAPLFFVSFLRLQPKKNFGILCFRASFAVKLCTKKSRAHRAQSRIFSLVCVHGDVVSASWVHPRGFQLLSHARGTQSTRSSRTWPRGRKGGDVSSSRAKLVFCLGSQILNFHSRAFSAYVFFK